MKIYKIILCITLSAIMLTLSVTPVIAEDDISVNINLDMIEFDVPPQIINDRTMVPMRAIFEALGASVNWDGDTNTINAKKDDTTITASIGNTTIFVDGTAKIMDVSPCIINDRTLVPVRFISEALGYDVVWLEDAKTVVISTDSTSTSFYSSYETAKDFCIKILFSARDICSIKADISANIIDALNQFSNRPDLAKETILPMSYGYLDLNRVKVVVQAYKYPTWEDTKFNTLQICDKVLNFNSDNISPEFDSFITLLKEDANILKQYINEMSYDYDMDADKPVDLLDGSGEKEVEMLETILNDYLAHQ